MSFGFSIGDFVTLSSLTLKLYRSFKAAPSEFEQIGRELNSFHIVVADLMDQAGDNNSCLNRHASSRRLELIGLRDNLVETMHELEDIYERYQRIGRISWSRFRLGQESLSGLRNNLSIQMLAVNTFVGSLNMATLGRMEPMLEMIFALLDERARGTVENAQTILSAREENTDEGEVAWARLQMELITDGVPAQYINGHREQIQDVLSTVVELNNLDGIDDGTVYASDSVSQAIEDQSADSTHQGPLQAAKRVSITRNPINRHGRSRINIFTTSPDLARRKKLTSADLPPKNKSSSAGPGPSEKDLRLKVRNATAFDVFKFRPSILSKLQGRPEDKLAAKAVCWAAQNGDRALLELLFRFKCDPSSKSEAALYKSAVRLAADAGHWDLVKLLVSRGADIKEGYGSGDNFPRNAYLPLSGSEWDNLGLIHEAALCNNVEIVSLLLEHGTPVDQRMPAFISKGTSRSLTPLWTPLHCAALVGASETVKFLLNRKGDPNIGLRIKIYARRLTEPAPTFPLEIRELVGFTPLHLAVKQRHFDSVRVLLDCGVNVNSKNVVLDRSWIFRNFSFHRNCYFDGDNSLSPLHLAVRNDDDRIGALLLDRGAVLEEELRPWR